MEQSLILSEKLHPKVECLDLERFSWKILNDKNRSKLISQVLVDISEKEYRRFLTLKVENPDVRLTPTPLMDLFWHAHILDTISYAEDCEKILGGFMHHVPNFGPYQKEGVLFNEEKSWNDTLSLYKQRFGEEPILGGIHDEGNCSTDQCHGCRADCYDL
tara:strand:- start:158 stop:637 length:480 start_codon:yes stop_codon:yes gene_type:complete